MDWRSGIEDLHTKAFTGLRSKSWRGASNVLLGGWPGHRIGMGTGFESE